MHLAKRFFGSLVPGGPPTEAEAWVASVLGEGEMALWRRMSGADRRHAVGVARRVEAALGERATDPVLAAALLHDVGKVESGLGTFARVVATVVGPRTPRLAQYRRHPEIGAELLRAAGSDPLTVSWAGDHHRPPERWTVPRHLADALKAADDD
ncbi:MAG TPA: HD domain-containing protein [Acidimicrobiales bacterium]|nr:HD domain-containing protein [Acidimicrobiales bacterium]